MGESFRRRARLHDGNSGGRTLTISTKKPRTKRRPKHRWLVLGTSNRQVDKPCLKLEVRAPTPSKQNNCHRGAATSEISDLQPGSPRLPVETMEACKSPSKRTPKEPFNADQIWPINIRWLTPGHLLEKVAYRQPSEETFLFIPVECRRLYLHPCIGVCEALPVHPEALITTADVFTGPLSHEEAAATAVDLLDIFTAPCSRVDTNSRLSPRAVRDGPFGPECWKFISEVGLPDAQPEDKAMALELLKILDESKRGQASCGSRKPSGGGCDSLHQDQQAPSEVEIPQESAPADWRDSDDLTIPGIMWELCADSSPCTEAGELQGLLAASLLLAQPITHPMQDTVFAYVKCFSSRVYPV